MNILIKLILINITVLRIILSSRVNLTHKEIQGNISKNIVPRKDSTSNGKKDQSADCLSLWDVDSHVVKFGKKGHPRLKRLNLTIPIRKTSKDFESDTDEDVRLNEKKRKRSLDLLCSATGGGVKCSNNNTEIEFNDSAISEDVIVEAIRAMLTKGVLKVKSDIKKEVPQCEEPTTARSSKQSSTREYSMETTVGHTERSTSTENSVSLQSERVENITFQPTPTVCNRQLSLEEKTKNVREALGPDMFLECTSEDRGKASFIVCKWKKKS
uniref:Uncharacterized protein n=1 Tax=Clastoptera arizonana TaxID=38151 RepID=A0A1B6CM62_9HEMI